MRGWVRASNIRRVPHHPKVEHKLFHVPLGMCDIQGVEAFFKKYYAGNDMMHVRVNEYRPMNPWVRQ